jgi:hypothetical protein
MSPHDRTLTDCAIALRERLRFRAGRRLWGRVVIDDLGLDARMSKWEA